MNARRIAFASIAVLAVSACTCTSDGLELKLDGEQPQALVTFDWRSSDDISGTMTASFSDGRQFSGPYFLITPETQVDQLKLLWQGWTGSHEWRHWQPGSSFVKDYGGEVLANLGTTSGERMRCQFRMSRDSSGMNGGGKGTCQIIDGITFHASFPLTRAGA
jgi:hypothetical protein